MNPLIYTGAAFVLCVLFGRWLLPLLRAWKAGQSIREIGPTWHSAKAGTPTMGGLMFISAALIVTVIAGIGAETPEHLYVFGFALVYGLIGFIDDFIKVKLKRNLGLTSLQKLLFQLVAAAAFLAILRSQGRLSGELFIPFWNVTVQINWIVYLALSLFVIIGTVNAVNLTDGIDGLATGVTIPVMLFFAVTAIARQRDTLTIVPAAMVGALVGFLYYNFHPAKVFMGDTGSLFLGGMVCGLAYALEMPLILVVVGLVYFIETLSVIIQVTYFKLTHGKRVFKMTPIHHHFEMCGWSEVKIFTVFTLVTAVMCVIAYLGIR